MRQESSDVRILVRAGELRCRNDWGSDLWREKGSVDEVLEVVMHEAPASDRKAPRDDTDQLVAVARPSVAPVPQVSLGATQSDEFAQTESRRVTTELNSELVRRARQQFRERQQAKGYTVSSPSVRPAAEREALIISNDYVPPSGRETGTESPIRFAELERRVADFHQVPEIEDLGELPIRPRDDIPTRRRTAASEAVSTRHRADSDSDVGHGEIPPAVAADDDLYPFAEMPETLPEPARSAGYRDLDRRERWTDEDALIVTDGHDRAALSDDDAFARWSTTRQDEPPPPPYSLWSDIPVRCQTCRDFRPAGDGGRGWCNNTWAFKHRRMVDADECPCETSIGYWWLPAHGAWQGDLDLAALGQPTPLMDKYFGRPGTAVDEHIEERRRRRS